MIFKQGKDTPLNANSGTVPDMSSTLLDWFQAMVFSVVTKVTQNFQVYETMVETTFQGVWQPLSFKQLMIKPEGQRGWNWFLVHADPSLTLEIDQIIIYLTKQYRVMARQDWTLYGYIEYHLVEDWQGSGPQVEP